MSQELANELFSFIKNSPTCFHAVSTMKQMLIQEGFIELLEGQKWILEKGGKYYVTRNHSSIIAFHIGNEVEDLHFQISASHSDSPAFKVKENAEIEIAKKYTMLDVEGYGGMLCSTWLDRPLSLAGRVVIKNDQGMETRLINVDCDLLMIPNVAIHMNRNANSGMSYNMQSDMLPIFGDKDAKGWYRNLIANTLGVDEANIYGMDMMLYNRMEGSIWGANKEYISSPRLDDLECAFTSLKAFISATNTKNINVFACFDNEEVGSSTKQGAASTFLYDALQRINSALGKTQEDYYCALASSFMMSCDNAHAVHPNHLEKSDLVNSVYMNEGVVVKLNANQKYTSDAFSSALCKMIAQKANVPLQFYANRSDMPGGSTLGNIASTKVSINSVDIGLAQLAMHSAYESAGIKDIQYMIDLLRNFYCCSICEVSSSQITIKF